jgi:hypothetical protein
MIREIRDKTFNSSTIEVVMSNDKCKDKNSKKCKQMHTVSNKYKSF